MWFPLLHCLAALQVGDDVRAESKLSEVTQLVPGEPAGWANWGILALRQRNYDTAAQRTRTGPAILPRRTIVYRPAGNSGKPRGHSPEAIAALQKATELNPQNLRAIYRLAEETERQGDENGAAEVQQLLQRILTAHQTILPRCLSLAALRRSAAMLPL